MVFPDIPTKKAFACVIMALLLLVCVSSIQPAKAQFIIAGWDGDDGYGQGISVVYIYENSTGSWVPIPESYVLPSASTTIIVNDTDALKIEPVYTLNHTYLELEDIDEGKNVIRGSIAVYVLGELVFSANTSGPSFVYNTYGVQTPTTWWIAYNVVIPILLVAGTIYVVVLDYEIFTE